MAEENNVDQGTNSKLSFIQNPMVMVIMVMMNMLVVAGVGVMVYLSKKKETAQPKIDDVIKGEFDTQQKERIESEEFIGKTIPMETFLVNLSGSQGKRLLKVNMELEVDGIKVQEEIDKRKPQIRDIIIILLSGKTYGQISNKEGIDHLRDEVRDTVNSFLQKGKISRVYFTEFIYN